MRPYLAPEEFHALSRFIADRYDEDPQPVKAVLASAPNVLLNVEMNIRTFAARHYSQHPQWREVWSPSW